MLPHYNLASLDITSLYTNLPVKETRAILANILKQKLIAPQIQRELLNWLDVITRQNYFAHKKQIVIQHDGIAMGTPSSVLITEIFLQHVEHSHTAPGQEFENKMASLGRNWKNGQEPRTGIKNKMPSLGFKKMALQDGVEFSPFWAFDVFLGMLSGRKTSRHSQCFDFWNLHAPYALGPRDWNSEAKWRRWGLNKEKTAIQNGIVWFKIEVQT